jgi:phospholipase/carboxylesterase
MTPLDRRRFLATSGSALAALISGCLVSNSADSIGADTRRLERLHRAGRLAVRHSPPIAPAGSGSRPLGLGAGRDGIIHVPARYRQEIPAPLVVMLHGAGGSAERAVGRLQRLADDHGVILLAVDSRDRTWDVVLGGFGPDPAFLDRALAEVFRRYAIDPARVAVEGFSDGASYALALGLANGDLFTHTIAFSPGMMPVRERHGATSLFVAHGTRDEILPIDMCSRRIVPELERLRYRVEYVEFDGPHAVPPAVAGQAVRWFLS